MDNTRVLAELEDLFSELDTLLKNPEVSQVLAEKGVNISLAIVAAEGLHAYLRGEKAQAAEDFSTVGEEIAARLARSKEGTNGSS